MSDQPVDEKYVNASEMCLAAGKKWYHFQENKKTEKALQKIVKITGISLENLSVMRNPESRVNSERKMWVHPLVAEELQVWLEDRKPTKDDAGYVYMVTGGLIEGRALKIGEWRGTPHRLRSRYATYYGSDLILTCVLVSDCGAVENTLHEQFKESKICGELYDISLESQVLEAMEKLKHKC